MKPISRNLLFHSDFESCYRYVEIPVSGKPEVVGDIYVNTKCLGGLAPAVLILTLAVPEEAEE